MGEPGFWDDQQRAAALSAEHARLTRRVERYESLAGEVDDLEELVELADDGELEELEAAVAPLSASSSGSRRTRSSSGEYDAGDAVVTIHAGPAGPTPRTGRRCCCACTCAGPATAASRPSWSRPRPGEEAGLKSATFTVAGENAYGILKAERGVHRLVRLSPFDQAHRRHTSFAQVIVSPLVADERRRRDRRGGPADRHVPGERSRRPAREQDRLGRPDHAPPDRDRRPVPERALAALEQDRRRCGS